MPRLAAPSTNESLFVHAALQQESLRVDGRSLLDARDVSIEFGPSYGSVEVTLGGSSSKARKGKSTAALSSCTRVSVQVSADIVKPRDERPFEGFVVIQNEISPLAGYNYEAGGRPSEDEILIGRALEKAIRRSEVVDRESLCIIAGQKVWQIRLDIHFTNDEGNMLDAASIACIAALQHFRKPEVTVEGNEVTVHSVEERVPTPLSLHHSPYCITFAFFGTITVCDPSLFETQLCSGTLTLTLNAQNEICVLTKAGGEALSVNEIMRIIGIGKQRVKEIDDLVKKALEGERGRLASGEVGY